MRFVDELGEGELDLDELRECLDEFPIRVATVFGSHATGKASSLSDLDVAVQFEERVSQDERMRLMDEVAVAVTKCTGFDAVDLVDLGRVGPVLAYEALRHGLLAVGSDEDANHLEALSLERKLDFEPVLVKWREALARRIEEGSYGRV